MIRADDDDTSSPILTQHINNASHGVTYTYDDGNALASQNRDVMTGESSVVIGAGGGGYNTVYNHTGASGFA